MKCAGTRERRKKEGKGKNAPLFTCGVRGKRREGAYSSAREFDPKKKKKEGKRIACSISSKKGRGGAVSRSLPDPLAVLRKEEKRKGGD